MLSQQNIASTTPTGARLVPGGATFKVWAPRATRGLSERRFAAGLRPADADRLMSKDARAIGPAFSGRRGRRPYRFWVTAPDPAATSAIPVRGELGRTAFPTVSPSCGRRRYPWHDAGFHTPDFSDIVVYQAACRDLRHSPRQASLQLLESPPRCPTSPISASRCSSRCRWTSRRPIRRWAMAEPICFRRTSLMSPAPRRCPAISTTINVFAAKGLAPLALADIASAPAQLKVLVDLCHVHGIAVVFDVVYNHAGGFNVNGAVGRQLPVLHGSRAKSRRQQ